MIVKGQLLENLFCTNVDNLQSIVYSCVHGSENTNISHRPKGIKTMLVNLYKYDRKIGRTNQYLSTIKIAKITREIKTGVWVVSVKVNTDPTDTATHDLWITNMKGYAEVEDRCLA